MTYRRRLARRFVDGRDRTIEYDKAVDALELLGDADKAHRAYAEAYTDKLRKMWADYHGLKQSFANPCIFSIMGKRCPSRHMDPDECRPPMSDHISNWNKNGKPEVFVTQPYPQPVSEIEKLIAFCKTRKLQLKIGTWPSWHFPGSCLMIEIRRLTEANKNSAPWGP